jgi:hypothetical protein
VVQVHVTWQISGSAVGKTFGGGAAVQVQRRVQLRRHGLLGNRTDSAVRRMVDAVGAQNVLAALTAAAAGG